MSRFSNKFLKAISSFVKHNSTPMIDGPFDNSLSVLLLINIITPSTEVLKKPALLCTHEVVSHLTVCSILTHLCMSVKSLFLFKSSLLHCINDLIFFVNISCCKILILCELILIVETSILSPDNHASLFLIDIHLGEDFVPVSMSFLISLSVIRHRIENLLFY